MYILKVLGQSTAWQAAKTVGKAAIIPVGMGLAGLGAIEVGERVNPSTKDMQEVEYLYAPAKFAYYKDSITNANRGKLLKGLKTNYAWANIAEKTKADIINKAIDAAKHNPMK